MKRAPLHEVQNKLSEMVKETESGPVVITKNGKPCAALVHLAEDEDMETFLLSHSPCFLEFVESGRRPDAAGGRDERVGYFAQRWRTNRY